MKKYFLIPITFCFFFLNTEAQKKDKKLYAKVSALLNGFNGDVGVYIKSLTTNKTVAINADTVFPTASIVKIPILIGILDKIEKNILITINN